jgi:hypothetical protein
VRSVLALLDRSILTYAYLSIFMAQLVASSNLGEETGERGLVLGLGPITLSQASLEANL